MDKARVARAHVKPAARRSKVPHGLILLARKAALQAQHVHQLVKFIDRESVASALTGSSNDECAAAMILLVPAATELLTMADQLAEDLSEKSVA